MKHLTNTFRSRWSRYLTLLALLGSLGWMPLAQAQSLVLSNLWSAAAGTESYPFLKNDHSSRGLAYNPVTDHILVPSRTGTPAIHILDSTTGAVLGTLPYDAGIITGGNFAVNMIGITDDGVIYVGNLTTDTTGANGPFRLYRWADESAQPELVYSGDPSNGETEANARRFGDSLALRGTGTGTQILLGTFLPNAAVLTTTDGTNFTATSIQTDMAAQDGRWGLVWGAGNTFYAKQGTGLLKKFNLDLGLGQAAVVSTIALPGLNGGPLALDLDRNIVAVVDTTAHMLRLYDIADVAAPIQLDAKDFPAKNSNGNFTGAIALRDNRLFALETNNGILACSLHEVYLPPTIVTQPGNINLWSGARNYPFRVEVSGTPPFSFQWRFQGVDIPGATEQTYVLPEASDPQAGAYSVVVNNNAGTVTSADATLTVTSSSPSAQVTNLWNVEAGTRPYFTFRPAGAATGGYGTYGVAINPVTTNIIVATRKIPTNMLAVLDIHTGEHKHYIDYSGLGVDQMNRVDVADDGIVYVCNIATTTATAFKIFAFGDDSPSNPDRWLAYSGDPGNGQTAADNGWGTTLSVRGGGMDTEILIGALRDTASTFAILRPDINYAFDSKLITVSGVNAGWCRLGLDWGPLPNTVVGKTANGNLTVVQYDYDAGTGSLLYSYPQTVTLPNITRTVPSSFTGLKYDPATKLLAGLRHGSPPSPVSVLLYDLTDLNAGPFLADQELFPTYNADIEFQGVVDFANGYLVALGINNGLMAFKVDPEFNKIPVILTQPADATAYLGTVASFSVVADSPTGLNYQWYLDGQILPGATDATLNLTDIQTSQAGVYTVRVSTGMGDGYRESRPATLTVLEPVQTGVITDLWSLAPGSRSYLNTDYNEYGMAFNPANSNLIVVSVVGGYPTVAVLDALTGDDRHILDVTTISGTGKLLHKVDVADDGVVYAGNLTTAAGTSPFKLYRWANDAADTVASVAFEGDPTPTVSPGKGCGYTLDVRGAGVDTEVLVGMGAWGATTNTVSILTTTDGVNFTANEIWVTNAPAGFSRLGLCFGEGNTFWGKAWRDEAVALGRLYLVEYDLAARCGAVIQTYETTQVSSTITSLAYQDELKLLAGIARDDQKNVMLYDVSNPGAGPQLLDQLLFPTYNPSVEANGELDFGGNTYLFALNENNGIMAFVIDPAYQPPATAFKILNVVAANGDITLQWEAQAGKKYQVQYATAVTGGWTDLGDEITATEATASYKDTAPADDARFYRILVK
ncbi:MAG TPA: hypothetical protein PLT00_05880 [Verrucomicrobiota bacterium]|nr:hypothetical protein [Verrucomicrobiota bacterium]HQB16226.1 hypothetical protein [Verrucomicrobiota bacterium]